MNSGITIRRSIRVFKEKHVEQENIDLMLRAAMQAPSARNGQPWRFLVIRDKAKLVEISEAFPATKMFKTADIGIVVLFDENKLTMIDHVNSDLASATTSLLIQAADLGIGTCWCGIYPKEERINKLKEIMSAPNNIIPFSLIAVGYPENENDLKFVDRFDESKVYYEKF